MKIIPSKGAFTEDLWNSIEDVFQSILRCNYVIKLSNGSLSHESFGHYLAQDLIYLRQYDEASQLLAGRSPDDTARNFFNQLATDGIKIEKIMHDEYLEYFHIHEVTEPSPAFDAYGNFILDHARSAPYPVAVAALLPCFWVYANVGIVIAGNSVKNNTYQKFIDTYAGAEYDDYVEKFIQLTEELGRQSPRELQEEMKKAFTHATEFELVLFEEAEKFSEQRQ
jgi:thiaminase/transcriptional activator TenA